MIVLDCTVRDGGYQNNWDFDIALINNYLRVMEDSKINAVEIGFRSPLSKNTGVFSKVSDEFIIDNLYIPTIDYFGVMINAAEITMDNLHSLFVYADKSPINLVRVAIHFKDIKTSEFIFKYIKDLGYTTTCNLMQAADKSFDEIEQAARFISGWGVVDVLYLADSLGGMNHDSVNYAYKAINAGWVGSTGFHAHNNKGQALDNSLEAIDIGVEWIDSTLLGMGRGPGNTETEYLLNELNRRGFGEFKTDAVYEMVLCDFLPLKLKYGWGPSLLYYLAADNNIHPTYIQKMLSVGFNTSKILNAVNYLSSKESNNFSSVLYEEALHGH